MSKLAVPMASTDAPAMVLSGRRLLIPETKTNPPATFTWGNRPRGAAFPSTTLPAIAFLTGRSPTRRGGRSSRERARGGVRFVSLELGVEIERVRSREVGAGIHPIAGHEPRHLELEPVRVLGVKTQVRLVVALAHQCPRLHESLAQPYQISQRRDLPRQVVQTNRLGPCGRWAGG